LIAIASSLASFFLLLSYREMGGPGDQLDYYAQASKLLPFTHPAYGPVYFAVIRIIHDVFRLDWFLVGKLTSWLSSVGFLILSFHLFKRVLKQDHAWLALALVALNPVFLGESYGSLTVMFGSFVVLAAVVLSLRADVNRATSWLLPGFVFGIAYLTRFQALGLLLGALAGTLFIYSGRITSRVKCALVLLAAAVLPIAGWNGFLMWYQEFIPRNQNFMHLALPLENFETWSDNSGLIKYGSLWGVLTSHWSAPLRIAAFAFKEGLKFPFGIGHELLFLAAAWLVPGAIVALYRREHHGPWLLAFVAGLLATGIGSLGWPHYYIVFIPFAAILIGFCIESFDQTRFRFLGAWSWAAVLASTIMWSPLTVRTGFLNVYWPEFTAAKQFLEARRDSRTLVSTTAAGFRYGTTMSFVDLDNVLTPEQIPDLVSHLRRQNVTELVITERHTLFNFPQLKDLLSDSPGNIPPGLERILLLKEPRRLAVYKVLPPETAPPGQ
jgi:hypothetical protein